MSDFDFRHWSHRAADWAADYHDSLRERPVRAQVAPGDIAAQIAAAPPESAESMEAIFADFERIVPGHGDVIEHGGAAAIRAAWMS